MSYHLVEAELDPNYDNDEETDVMRMLDKMSEADRALISLLPHDLVHMYSEFWMNRPDAHASHRDTLPAFMAGLFAGLRR